MSEQEHRTKFEADVVETPLPPTPITKEARIRLRRWGVPDEYIERLRVIMALWRYDRCPQKMARLVKNGAYLFKLYNCFEAVFIPDYFDKETRLDGQCGDIAAQLIRALNYSGFLAGLNASLAAKHQPRVIPVYSDGLSRTHFNTEGSKHIWAGLLQEGGDPEYQVVLDASFQEIANLEISGYKLSDSTLDPKSLGADPGVAVVVSKLESGDQGPIIRDYTTIILGVSYDKMYAYGLGFAKRAGEGRVHPFLSLCRGEADSKKTCVMLDKNGKDLWFGKTDDIDCDHLEELTLMLDQLRQLRVIADQRKGSKLAKETKVAQLCPPPNRRRHRSNQRWWSLLGTFAER